MSAADRFSELLRDERIGASWREDSALAGMTIGMLAAHAGRAITQVLVLLELPRPDGGREVVSAERYFARMSGTADRSAELNRGVEARSREDAGAGWEALIGRCAAAREALAVRLAAEPAGRRVPVPHRPSEQLFLDEYLRTRLVEIAVHADDLRVSLGDPADLVAFVDSDATGAAIEVLAGAARERSGDLAVLRALARRERDPGQALRVL